MLHAERLKLRRGRHHHRDQQKFPDLETLPPEVGMAVLKHLNATDLCLASCVWNMANDDVLWMGLCKATWNYATIYRKQRDANFSFRRLYLILDEGSLTFNADPESGIEYLVAQGVLDNHPRELAAFIHGTQTLRWKPLRIFLENRPDVLDELVIRQNYRNQFLPNALRKFFLTIHAPEERGDYLQKLVEKFSQRFCQCNPDCGLSPGTCALYIPLSMLKFFASLFPAGVIEVLCFALILLSVDLSSPHVKNKMSKREFIKNLRHATPETDPEFAGHLYDNIYLVGHVAPND
uniref:SEC7 domain-containing protein n=1 Tax=Branchiostoma floridae TaxID=7739 RepID=C3XW71_BRAFL|eukprot:XP_002611595.1 hypothetical protein BRAFLDRAFT_63757 [Branchiostoma floridae]